MQYVDHLQAWFTDRLQGQMAGSTGSTIKYCFYRGLPLHIRHTTKPLGPPPSERLPYKKGIIKRLPGYDLVENWSLGEHRL